MAKNKQKRKTVKKGKDTYIGALKNGKVVVKSQKTSQGQEIVAGVFTVATGKWHNDSIPRSVKEIFESAFA